MGAKYSSYVKSIATFALTFFGCIISVLASPVCIASSYTAVHLPIENSLMYYWENNIHISNPLLKHKKEKSSYMKRIFVAVLFTLLVYIKYLLILDCQWSSEKDASFSLVCHWAF